VTARREAALAIVLPVEQLRQIEFRVIDVSPLKVRSLHGERGATVPPVRSRFCPARQFHSTNCRVANNVPRVLGKTGSGNCPPLSSRDRLARIAQQIMDILVDAEFSRSPSGHSFLLRYWEIQHNRTRLGWGGSRRVADFSDRGLRARRRRAIFGGSRRH